MELKKDFQKVIGAIRKDQRGDYPKAMMTGQQMAKNTATVNCGGEWRSAQYSWELADLVTRDERFVQFLARHNATAHIEPNPFGGSQVRINY